MTTPDEFADLIAAPEGMNLVFERAILHSKPLPDFAGFAAHKVCLTLQGTMGGPACRRARQTGWRRKGVAVVLDVETRQEQFQSRVMTHSCRHIAMQPIAVRSVDWTARKTGNPLSGANRKGLVS